MVSPEQVKEFRIAQYVTRTAIHPETGEFIPWPMRMSTFIPIKMPIWYGMTILAPTPFNTICSQWMNQSLNAVINYGNRNTSAEYTAMDIIKSYGSACTVSIGGALAIRKGLSSWTNHMKGAKL